MYASSVEGARYTMVSRSHGGVRVISTMVEGTGAGLRNMHELGEAKDMTARRSSLPSLGQGRQRLRFRALLRIYVM